MGAKVILSNELMEAKICWVQIFPSSFTEVTDLLENVAGIELADIISDLKWTWLFLGIIAGVFFEAGWSSSVHGGTDSVLRGVNGYSMSHPISPGVMSGIALAGMRTAQGISKDRKSDFEGISQYLSYGG